MGLNGPLCKETNSSAYYPCTCLWVTIIGWEPLGNFTLMLKSVPEQGNRKNNLVFLSHSTYCKYVLIESLMANQVNPKGGKINFVVY